MKAETVCWSWNLILLLHLALKSLVYFKKCVLGLKIFINRTCDIKIIVSYSNNILIDICGNTVIHGSGT